MVYFLFATILILVALLNGSFWDIKALNVQAHTTTSQYPLGNEKPDVYFSEKWLVLGPFRCGTRGQS
jgi:hypothetical protein